MGDDVASDQIHSRAYRTMRAELKATWQSVNAACYFCGQSTIDWNGEANQPDSFELQHIVSRRDAKAMGRPDLILDPSNCAPSHHQCNRSAGHRKSRPTLGETSEEY